MIDEAVWGERRLFSAVLDCFDTGVALLGDARDVVHANDAMRGLETLGVFRLERRSLSFADRAASDAFDELLGCLPGNECGAGAFVARDPGRNHALFVRIIPGASGEIASGGGCGAIVLATNPSGRTLGDSRLFQIALGLSRAESAVAAALLQGLGAKEAALHLHVSHETVRTHLKRIFEKTRTRRQTELLLVLLQVARVGIA